MRRAPYRPTARLLLSALALPVLFGCSEMATDLGMRSSQPATIEAEVEKIEPVTQTGRPAAVLHVHMRKSYQNACKYGMTLTNNLPFKVTNLTFRLTAYVRGDVPFETLTRNFYQVRPGERQYREMTFQQVTCDEIDRIEVSDPGRCTLGELNPFTAEAGDCAKFTDVADSRLVDMVKKQR